MVYVECKNRRPARSYKTWWCSSCDAEFSENEGQWVCGFSMSDGGTTGEDRFYPIRRVPANVCPCCESKYIEPPLQS